LNPVVEEKEESQIVYDDEEEEQDSVTVSDVNVVDTRKKANKKLKKRTKTDLRDHEERIVKARVTKLEALEILRTDTAANDPVFQEFMETYIKENKKSKVAAMD